MGLVEIIPTISMTARTECLKGFAISGSSIFDFENRDIVHAKDKEDKKSPTGKK
jgi:hypothetical protein